MTTLDCSTIKGFNYQGGWGSNGLELWRNFDADRMELDLLRGKHYFPAMNAIRLWLSYDAFIRDEEVFANHFRNALTKARIAGVRVMPVLFNRWHDCVLDYGGIYIDHLLPKSSWVQSDDMFGPFVRQIVSAHANDPTIFAWDLCNEPFAYGHGLKDNPAVYEAELAWLTSMRDLCKEAGASQPITVGIHQAHGLEGIQAVDSLCDILSCHPYYLSEWQTFEEYIATLDMYADFASKAGKGMIASETCWGAEDDAERVENLRITLSELRDRNFGWLVYALNHSPIADIHRREDGAIGAPKNLLFIEKDGSLRPGHEAWNDYV